MNRSLALKDYWPYLVFVVVLLAADGIWKMSIDGNDAMGAVVTLWGIDVSYYFDLASRHLTDCVYAVVHTVEGSVRYRNATTLCFENGNGMMILWGCTPIKQLFIWLCLLLAAPEQSRHKLWYIPMGGLLIYGINIVRIACLTLLIHHHTDLFGLMHDYVFKYVFYLFIFLLYVLYVHLSGKWLGTGRSRKSADRKSDQTV